MGSKVQHLDLFRGATNVVSDPYAAYRKSNPTSVDFIKLDEVESLDLARKHQFDHMCKDILWGSEKDDTYDFHNLLYGVVQQFRPKNYVQLYFLVQIVEVMWQLQRMTKYRAGVFDATKDQRGEHGMPKGTIAAMERNKESKDLTHQLKELVESYRDLQRQVD